MASEIAVLGANGHTGRFVVALLRQLGHAAIPATRSGRFVALDGAEEACRILDFESPQVLDEALAGAAAVINCAGPFFDTAEPTVGAARRARIPYLDLCAEQVTSLRLFERYDAAAKEAGITIVPAMAFYGGLADLLVSACAPADGGIDHVEVAVGLDGWHPTAGTRKTGEKNTYDRLILRDGGLVTVPSPPPADSWDFPPPFGTQPVTCVALSEIVLVSRHLQVESMTSFMNLKPLDDLHDAATPPPEAVDASGRSAQRFIVDVRVTAAGETRLAIAEGHDIYAASAPLVVKACLALLDRSEALHGVRAPGEVLDAAPFLMALAPDIRCQFSFSR